MMSRLKTSSAEKLTGLAAGGSLSLLIGAFFFQALGFLPCKMCLWQRWPHGAAVVIGLLYLSTRQKLLLPLGALAAAITSGLGAYHTGVERAWWEGPSSCTSSGNELLGLSGSDLLPSGGAVEQIILCNEVSWQFLGLSMASYNFIFAGFFTIVWIFALKKA